MSEEGICPENVECVDTKEFPSMMEMAKNLMGDGAKIINNALQGNTTLVSDDVRNTRWSTCTTCPSLKDDRCVECGCFMKVKVAFVTSKCPIGKW